MDAREQLREVERLSRAIYADTLRDLTGVVHCVSCLRAPDGRLHVIQINAHAPKSALDFFVLNLARAHADAIVTTAQVVRAEPQLSHALQGPLALGLACYRREVLGKASAPCAAILTHGTQLPAAHRVFRDALPTLVLTLPERAGELAAQLRAAGTEAEVLGVPGLDIRTAVSLLEQRGARTILIEAGPSTAGQLYDPPALVSHLLLSRYEGVVDARAVGGALPLEAALLAGLHCSAEYAAQEPSGPWRFQHWQRSQ